ncbi:helix-turn-helix domain-containing protein [Pseudomonas protegens]|uniref:helix-turn-helix domain-containing protein n=1 Tax=Pseudomonas protegens TaxID=380021 RepID=UPI001883514D|nr:transcriptional regulator [Pseudomonas protegens]MBF0639043.1 transcriptional regulator [Pseudomonas protegens]
MQTFGERLKEQRKALGLSQQEFGAIGGVEANAQGRYESGERVSKSDYLMAIGRHGVDLLYVLTGERSRLSEGSLSLDESTIIQNYRHLGDEDQEAIAQLASSLAEC